MKWLLIGIGAYVVLNVIKGKQYDAVMNSCGYPTGPTCQPQLNVINARWKWLPDPSSFGPL